MALTTDKFPLPNGPPSGGNQIMKSSSWGEDGSGFLNNGVLKMPIADSTSGKVVTTDGIGNLTLQEPAVASNGSLLGVGTVADPLTVAAPDGAGLYNGGLITINGGDNTLFDVAAGTGVVTDYTDLSNPVPKAVSFGPFIGESLPDITTGVTLVFIDKDANIVKLSGVEPSSFKRTHITLQAINHASQTQIDSIGDNTFPAIDYVKGLGDYIDDSPALNTGNLYTVAGANLNLNKGAGTTLKPFINYRNDIQNPSIVTNASETTSTIIYTSQDGVGGFDLAIPTTVIDPDQFDDGSGTLASVAVNKFTTQLISFVSQTGPFAVVTYGQTIYNSMADALEDVPYQTLVLNPLLELVPFVNILIVRSGTTALNNSSDASLLINRFNF